MRLIMNFKLYLVCAIFLFSMAQLISCSELRKPNVIIFVVDDLGIGDVGCFGNATMRTPNIDSIGKNGAILRHNLAADALCTPSRAALLTGRYPIRSGMACHNDAYPVILFISSPAGLPVEETTIADIAKSSGYSTGLFGKWHEGLSCNKQTDFCHHPLNHGFDTFYGFPSTNLPDFGPEGGGLFGFSATEARRSNVLSFIRNTTIISLVISFMLVRKGVLGFKMSLLLNLLWLIPTLCLLWMHCHLKFLNSMIMRNFEVVEQPIRFENLTRRIVSETIGFMEEAVSKNNPFLAVVSWFQVHTYLHSSSEHKGKSLHGQYGDNVEEMDWGVGQILNALKPLDRLDDTFVYLTSDNGGSASETGPGGGCHGGHNGIFRGQKGESVMDGGIRVPAVVMWKGRIQPGTVVDVPTSLMDLLPTLRDSVFERRRAPPDDDSDVIVDGKNIYPLLSGSDEDPPHKFLFHYCCREVQAARYTTENGKDVYKVYFATPKWINETQPSGHGYCNCELSVVWNSPPLVYNIGKDPSEKDGPLPFSDPTYTDVLEKVKEGLEEHRESILKEGGTRETQMNLLNMLPRPWLQPCCNFPWCQCTDPAHPDLVDF